MASKLKVGYVGCAMPFNHTPEFALQLSKIREHFSQITWKVVGTVYSVHISNRQPWLSW